MKQSRSSYYWTKRIDLNTALAIKLPLICLLIAGAPAIFGHASGQKAQWILAALIVIAEVYLFAHRLYAKRSLKQSLRQEKDMAAQQAEKQAQLKAEEAEKTKAVEEARENRIQIEGTVFEHLPKTYAGSYEVPEGITQIGPRAFKDCKGLIQLNLPSTLERIGYEAFQGCTGLMQLELPESVRSVGPYAFAGCLNLRSPIHNSHLFAFMPKDYRGSYTLPETITEISPDAFDGCYGISSPVYNAHIFAFMPRSQEGHYSLPDGIQTVAEGAFSGCEKLSSVTLPNSLCIIGEAAFKDCTGLTDVDWGAGVEEIGSEAFAGCTSLQEMILPISVSYLGDDPFVDCTSLKRLVVRQCDEPIDILLMLWRCPKLEEVEIPEDWEDMLKESWEEYLNELEYDDVGFLFDDLCEYDEDFPEAETESSASPQAVSANNRADETDFSACFPHLRRLVFYGPNRVKTYEGLQIKKWLEFRPYVDDID